jgi:hypothetical protein
MPKQQSPEVLTGIGQIAPTVPRDAIISSQVEEQDESVPGRAPDANLEQVEVNIDLGKERVTKRQRMRQLRDAAIADLESEKPIGLYKTALNMGITRNTFYAWHKDSDWDFYKSMIEWAEQLIVKDRLRLILFSMDKEKSVSYLHGYLNRVDPISTKSEQTVNVKHQDPKKMSNEQLIDLVKAKKGKN